MMRVTNVEIRRRINFKMNIMQLIMKREIGLFTFGYICRMDNSRKIKRVMTGVMEEQEQKEDRVGSG